MEQNKLNSAWTVTTGTDHKNLTTDLKCQSMAVTKTQDFILENTKKLQETKSRECRK